VVKQTDKIRNEWESAGWFCINLIATNKNGIPDFQMIKKGEIDCFVESKEKNDQLSELQKRMINKLLGLGKRVFINELEVTEALELNNFDI
jgi:hypothetical protein